MVSGVDLAKTSGAGTRAATSNNRQFLREVNMQSAHRNPFLLAAMMAARAADNELPQMVFHRKPKQSEEEKQQKLAAAEAKRIRKGVRMRIDQAVYHIHDYKPLPEWFKRVMPKAAALRAA